MPISTFVDTKVKLDFERGLLEHINKKRAEAVKLGDLGEDVVYSFLKGLKEGKISLSPTKK